MEQGDPLEGAGIRPGGGGRGAERERAGATPPPPAGALQVPWAGGWAQLLLKETTGRAHPQ